LIGVFFRYEELNSFYLEKSWIQEKSAICYNPGTVYTVNDIPWMCTFFAVLAIGTQMAHMEEDHPEQNSEVLEDLNDCSEDSVGLVFYHVASKLVPDVFLAASYESVQAFLLLAAWALPISTGGLSYTYFGLSMKMAIQNGMHRKYVGDDCDDRVIELRNRLFWTVYTLEMYNISITLSETALTISTGERVSCTGVPAHWPGQISMRIYQDNTQPCNHPISPT
jgi:hypothetical protein